MVFFTFAALFCLRALLSCGVYAAFRCAGRRFPLALRNFGGLALVAWAGAFAYFALHEEFIQAMPGPEPPYPVAFVADVGTALLITLVVGGILVRWASQKEWNWWQGVLFCALYLGTVYQLENWALNPWGFEQALSQSWLQLVLHLNFRLLSVNFVATQELVNWLFPLGASVAEIAIHSFWRTSLNHRNGYAHN